MERESDAKEKERQREREGGRKVRMDRRDTNKEKEGDAEGNKKRGGGELEV